MNKSSIRGIFLSITLLFSIALVTIPSSVYAEEINMKSFAFEETTIIEFTNDSDVVINTFRIWPGNDFSFKSFKTEKGWVGDKNSQGVIIFTSSEPIKPSESVKFGVKADKVKPEINWNALDKEDNQIDIGKIEGTKPPEPEQTPENIGAGIVSESVFRIIPESPNVGSSIRVTGDKFGASQEFDFYINTKKIGSFETDENGHFITTMKIPEDQKADRIDFIIKDKDSKEKKISLRIGEVDNRIPGLENIKLTIKGIPDVIHRGNFLEIFGTGEPNKTIAAEIINEEGEIINSRTAEIDSKGNWKLDEPIVVALDTPFGNYSLTITDGRQTILKQWTVESDKVIIITPSNLKFDQGEIMKFNGTALPNKPIAVTLEDPHEKGVFSDIVQVDDSGFIEFEFPTDQSAIKGTYTLIVTQENEKEFVFVGIGQLPSIPVNLELDKLSYKTGETAVITITGKGSDVVSLLIVDSHDKPKGETISITLQPDGRGTYSLDLEEYSSDVYTAVITKGNTKSTEIFAVGLPTSHGNIEIKTTKTNYLPGDSILVLGNSSPHTLLNATLFDPDGNKVRVIENTWSNKEGRISEESFWIPRNAKSGTWTINVESGSNSDTVGLEVLSEGMQLSVGKGGKIATGKETYVSEEIITIKVLGVKQSGTMEILTDNGEVIANLEVHVTKQGEVNLPWKIPKELEPGIYTVKVTDAFDSTETTFEVVQK